MADSLKVKSFDLSTSKPDTISQLTMVTAEKQQIEIKKVEAKQAYASRKQNRILNSFGNILDRRYVRLLNRRTTPWLLIESPFTMWRVLGLDKEPYFYSWVDDHINDGDVVWDVGANIGVMAMAIAELTPGAEVHAFEPVPSSFASLQHNTVFNGMSRIKCWPIAMHSKNGSLLMNLDSYASGSSLHDAGDADAENPLVAISHRADDMKDFNIPDPDHMKIDVDGFEMDVLDGMKRLLTGNKLQTVQIEVERDSLEDVDEIFRDAKFVTKIAKEHILKSKGEGDWDTKDILYVRQ